VIFYLTPTPRFAGQALSQGRGALKPLYLTPSPKSGKAGKGVENY